MTGVPIYPDSSNWPAPAYGIADGEPLSSDYVNLGAKSALAAASALRIAMLGDWSSRNYTHSGQANGTQRKIVFGGWTDPAKPLDYQRAAWSIAQNYSSTVETFWSYSGSYEASGVLPAWTTPVGCSVRGIVSHIGQVVVLNSSGIGTIAGITGFTPVSYGSGMGSLLDTPQASYSFPGTGGAGKLLVVDSLGCLYLSTEYLASWSSETVSKADTYVGCATGGGIYATATTARVYRGTSLAQCAGQSLYSVPVAGGTIVGLTYDRFYGIFVAWVTLAAGTNVGIYKSADCVTWTPCGPSLSTEGTSQFGTNHGGAWLSFERAPNGNDSTKVFSSMDAGATWAWVGQIEDTFVNASGCNEIAYGDRRFAAVGKNRVWFSGRLA